MAEQRGNWLDAAPPVGWVPPHARQQGPPSLLPPLRPFYREPHPVRAVQVLTGLGATLIWLALFGSIGRDLLTYAWWTVVATVSAWIVAILLGIFGDRGVAVGVAAAGGFGLSVAAAFVASRWITTADWPMW
jgi:hypothetical protein